jgi:hypothetical protein
MACLAFFEVVEALDVFDGPVEALNVGGDRRATKNPLAGGREEDHLRLHLPWVYGLSPDQRSMAGGEP